MPSGERLASLRTHPKWHRVPSAFFRASRALLATLVLCTLGIPLDSAANPWRLYEATVVVGLVFSLVRVIASVVALDQIVSVSQAQQQPAQRVNDPGP
jgi:hypothetical protein